MRNATTRSLDVKSRSPFQSPSSKYKTLSAVIESCDAAANGFTVSASGSAVLEDTNGIIYMTNFVANREFRYYGFHMFGNFSQDRNFDNFGGGMNSTNATTGIVILPESGSWASGTLALYGIAQ